MVWSDPPPLPQLATFVAVLDEGGFDAAARRLSVSPPAVSQRIRALEAGLGQVVIQRVVPPEPTRAGVRLLPYARRILALAAEAANAAQGVMPDDAVQLPLAVNADSLSTWFMGAIAAYPQRDDVRFHVERVDQDLAARALAEGRVLGAVSASDRAAPGCVAHRLGVMRYVPVASPGFVAEHGLNPGRSGIGARLEQVPMVDYDADDTLQRDFLEDWLGRTVRPSFHRFPDSPAFIRAIESGLGWGLVSEDQGRESLAAGRLVTLSATRHRDVGLYWHQWDLTTEALEGFGRHLIDYAAARLRG
jgi:LysR family transcriptional regulator (chromosome initiation inhibitor)